jgi:hypothetical protein
MRVVTITTAPSGGTAPPASPVPDAVAARGADACGHLVGRAGEAHDTDLAAHQRRIAAVEVAVGRVEVDPVRTERVLEVGDERGVHGRILAWR